MTEEQVLDALMAAVRTIAMRDGVPGRLTLSGYGHFSVEIQVQDYDIVGVDVGSRATMRKKA